MTIYLDADSASPFVREVLTRRALREELPLYFVANRLLKVAQKVHMIVVETFAHSADLWILDNMREGDLLVTRDIPLAAQALDKGGYVVNDRGREFTKGSIRSRLAERAQHEELRLLGLQPDAQSHYGEKEKRAFADCFDKLITRTKRG